MSTDVQAVGAVPTQPSGFSWRRAGLAFGITLLGIIAFGLAFATGYATFHQGRALPGVSVGGVSLAGLDRDAAQNALRQDLPDITAGELTIRLGDESVSIPYAQIDRRWDVETMLDDAFSVGRSGTLPEQVGQQLSTLMSGVTVPLAVKFDSDVLATRVSQITSTATRAPVDAIITRPAGTYRVTSAVDGASVDAPTLLASAMAALDNVSERDVAVAADLSAVPAAVSTAQAQAAVDQANAVAAQPLAVSVAGKQLTIEPETINGWLHLEQSGPGTWRVVIEQAPIDQWVDQLKAQVDVPATDAGYTFEGNKAVVTTDAQGSELDGQAASTAIMSALSGRIEGSPGGSVQLAMATVEPEFTTNEAQSLVTRVKRLATWTTRYDSSSHNGFGQNIRRPTNLINGTVVGPGEEFDFLAVAGPITVANGYTDGAAIIHGNSVLDGVLGGGLCSTSTTLFNAALRAGFQIDARRNHAYYIDRYPVGLDATIWVNGSYAQTMAFTNDSPYPILIRGINGKNSVTFSIYGVPDGRQVHIRAPKVSDPKRAWTQYVYTADTSVVVPGARKRVEYQFDGFQSSVERVVTDASGKVIHDDTFNSSYRRVIGQIMIGWQPGDPPPGTIQEPGKPPGA